MPGLSFSSSSASKSGQAQQGGSAIDGVFSVNYGNGVSQGAGSSSGWLLGAIVVGAILGFAWKRFT
jgi:hypothetical protein